MKERIMSDIKVSVLTPVYNHAIEYVRQCLDSLKAQTLQEIEFILLDNGAPEDVKQLIEEYIALDNRFKAIHFEQNVGYSKAMNTGINYAKGEYIGIVESDDYIGEKMYEELYDIAQKTNVEVVKSNFYKYENNKKQLVVPFPKNVYNHIITDIVYNCPKFALGHVSHWSAIYKKDFLDLYNIRFNEDPKTGIQDFGFIQKVFIHLSSLYITSKAYLRYRMDNTNSSIAGGYKMVNRAIKEHLYVNKLYEDAEVSPEYWEINAKGKFLSLEHHRKNNCQNHELEFLRRVSSIYKYLLKEKNVQLNYFSADEKKIFKRIAYHPYIFFIQTIYKNTNITPVSTQVKYLGGIFKREIKNNIKSSYFLGIRYYKKKLYENSLNIIKNENKINFTKLKHININLKTLIQCQSLHKETFGPYKYAFKDKTVVLVASGPTVQYHLPIENAVYVGVNNACLLENVKLDFLFCQDFYMDEEKRNAIVNYRPKECQKFFGRISDERISQCKNSPASTHVRRCPKYLIHKAEAKEYYVSDDIQNSYCLDIENEPLMAGGIAFAAMQFILHTHPQKIYLVGCDCSKGFFYKSDIVFDNTNMLAGWIALKAHIDELYPDIEIVSINPVGLRGLFKDEYSDNYLESFDEKERAALNV